MSTKKRRASTSAKGKDESDKEETKEVKPSKKSKTESEVKRLRQRVEELEHELQQASRGVTAIVSTDIGSEEADVSIYYTGPGADDAWREACKNALRGDAIVVKVAQAEPLEDEGETHFFSKDYLHPHFDKDRLELIVGVDSDKEGEEEEEEE